MPGTNQDLADMLRLEINKHVIRIKVRNRKRKGKENKVKLREMEQVGIKCRNEWGCRLRLSNFSGTVLIGHTTVRYLWS